MLNRSGVRKSTYGAPTQILANVELQSSVGCIVPSTLGVTVGNRKLVKAGTPINIDLENINQVTSKPSDSTSKPMNAVLLHDVDVTDGNANGTALIFGFINLNRLDADVQSAISEAQAFVTNKPSPLLTFMKV